MHKASQPDQWTVIPYPAVEGKPMVVRIISISIWLNRRRLARWRPGCLSGGWKAASSRPRWMKMSNTVPLGQTVESILGGFRSENPQWRRLLTFNLSHSPSRPGSMGVDRWCLGMAPNKYYSRILPWLISLPSWLRWTRRGRITQPKGAMNTPLPKVTIYTGWRL